MADWVWIDDYPDVDIERLCKQIDLFDELDQYIVSTDTNLLQQFEEKETE